MENNHYFTCPRCGGHHFGIVRDVVHCHNAEDGSPLIDVMTRIIEKLPKQKPCNWRGMWPVNQKGGE